jgi:hypothetical protein
VRYLVLILFRRRSSPSESRSCCAAIPQLGVNLLSDFWSTTRPCSARGADPRARDRHDPRHRSRPGGSAHRRRRASVLRSCPWSRSCPSLAVRFVLSKLSRRSESRRWSRSRTRAHDGRHCHESPWRPALGAAPRLPLPRARVPTGISTPETPGRRSPGAVDEPLPPSPRAVERRALQLVFDQQVGGSIEAGGPHRAHVPMTERCLRVAFAGATVSAAVRSPARWPEACWWGSGAAWTAIVGALAIWRHDGFRTASNSGTYPGCLEHHPGGRRHDGRHLGASRSTASPPTSTDPRPLPPFGGYPAPETLIAAHVAALPPGSPGRPPGAETLCGSSRPSGRVPDAP